MRAITVRFNDAPAPARWVTLTAQPVDPIVVREAARALYDDPDAAATTAALARVAAEAFPRSTWRERMVQPAARMQTLATDLQVQLLRALCPGVEVLHGL